MNKSKKDYQIGISIQKTWRDYLKEVEKIIKKASEVKIYKNWVSIDNIAFNGIRLSHIEQFIDKKQKINIIHIFPQGGEEK